MAQAGESARLAMKALGKGWIPRDVGRQNLQRDHPIEVLLTSLVHPAHAPLGDQVEDLEVRKVRRERRWIQGWAFPSRQAG
jgi:hypothetical protein